MKKGKEKTEENYIKTGKRRPSQYYLPGKNDRNPPLKTILSIMNQEFSAKFSATTVVYYGITFP